VVEGNPTPVGGGSIECTVSMGVAERRDGETRHQLVDRADTALYEAKQRGRNRVVAG
jgi:diguanylate cyclase (GGDEF)-like protein